jgi:hypothetical protein
MSNFARGGGSGGGGVGFRGVGTVDKAQQGRSPHTSADALETSSDEPCFQIVSAGPGGAVGHSSSAIRPFTPLNNEDKDSKKVEFTFTLSLKEASFSFSGGKPFRAIAKYSSGTPPAPEVASSANPAPAPVAVADEAELEPFEPHGKGKAEGSASGAWTFKEDFLFKNGKGENDKSPAPLVSSCGAEKCSGSAEDVHALKVKWSAGSEYATATLTIKKTLIKKGDKFGDNWMQITLFAASLKSSAEVRVDVPIVSPEASTATTAIKKKKQESIKLCAPFLINLSVSWLALFHTIIFH